MSKSPILQIEPSFLPDRQQSMLIEAIFAEDALFEAKHAVWLESVDLKQLDRGSLRLMPLLLDRLNGHTANLELLSTLRAVNRHSWAKNQCLIRHANTAAEVLSAQGVEVIALKGIPLASYHYANPRLRPMNDIDFLVRREHLISAGDALIRGGWRAQSTAHRSEFGCNIVHAVAYTNVADPSIVLDLHGRTLPFRFSEEAMENLWRNARALPRTSMQMPGAADMLLHICAHGARYNPFPPVRWIADGLTVLRREAIDWRYLIQQSASWRVSYPVARCLDHMASIGARTIPKDVIGELYAHATDAAHQRLYQIEQSSYHYKTGIFDQGHLQKSIFLHRHTATNTNLSPPGRPRYLSYIFWRCGQRGTIRIAHRTIRLLWALIRRAAGKGARPRTRATSPIH